jgi:hypothetical protein
LSSPWAEKAELFPPAPTISDVLWGQLINLVQVASTSKLLENHQNALLFFEIVPCHFCGASEIQT